MRPLAIILVLLLSTVMLHSAQASGNEKFVVYYANKEPVTKFKPYQLVIFDRTSHPPIQALKETGKTVLGYVSVGEVEGNSPYYNQVKSKGLILQQNKNWKESYFVDLRDPLWPKIVIEEIIPAVLRQGFDGIFIDTLDNQIELQETNPEKYKGMTEAAAHMVEAIRLHYPTIKIMLNRAYGLLPDVANSIDMELGKSVYADYNFDTKKYGKVKTEDYQEQVELLHEAQEKNPKLKVYTLDYAEPSNTKAIADIYQTERNNGFIPYVATVDLDRVVDEPRITLMRRFLVFCALIGMIGASSSATAEDVVPRTIIGLYNGGDIQASYIHNVAEMPLNHLGLNVEYHDIHEPLPDLSKRKDVRGVITWFYGDVFSDAHTYLKWALSVLDAGKKFVIVGSLGISDTDRRYAASTLSNRFLGRMGLRMSGRSTGKPFNINYDYRTPEMFLEPNTFDWLRPPYDAMQVINPELHVHLAVHQPGTDSNEDGVLIVTGPVGSYLDAEYAIRTNQRNNEVTQWVIDPFEFFRLAYNTDEIPKPDVTTLAGRRIYYSNIDGDGWNNVTRLEQYRDKKILSAQVILEKVIKPYPDLPVMVAPIAADLDPKWVGSERARSIAREIWAEPQVEAGSHTYSHPFDWQFFANANPDDEIPYLHLYNTPVWQPKGGIPTTKPPPLQGDYTVPRGFANEPFEIHKEIEGSIKEMETLLPKGKTIDVLAWPGDCTPWEDVIHMTREAKLQNINGGDSRFDPEYPAYASIAPIGRQVGKERQIYNSTSNEISYTDSWEDDFYAFGFLKATLANTEMPVRLSASSVYYHIYSGEREASLNALLSDLNYMREQNIAPITVKHYTQVAEGFYSTQLTSLGNDTWRVENRERLQTIRFDRASFESVDFEHSHGIIGERHFQGSLYIYLDETVDAPTIAIKSYAHYYREPEEDINYLIQSRWVITNLKRNGSNFDFTAQGYGAGEMKWQVASPGTYRIEFNGKNEDIKVGNDRLLNFSLGSGALQPVHITVTKNA